MEYSSRACVEVGDMLVLVLVLCPALPTFRGAATGIKQSATWRFVVHARRRGVDELELVVGEDDMPDGGSTLVQPGKKEL